MHIQTVIKELRKTNKEVSIEGEGAGSRSHD